MPQLPAFIVAPREETAVRVDRESAAIEPKRACAEAGGWAGVWADGRAGGRLGERSAKPSGQRSSGKK